MKIDDLKLRTKALIPLAAMALAVTGMVIFGAHQLASLSGKASEIIEHRDGAAVQMARASRSVLLISHSVSGALIFDSESKAGRAAAEGFPQAIKKGEGLFAEATKLFPDKALEIGQFVDRFRALIEKAKPTLQLAIDTPSLANGSKLKPAELDKMAVVARQLEDIDNQAAQIIADILIFNDKLRAENAQAAADLRAQSTNALIALVAVGFVATVLAGIFSVWMSSSKIAAPLALLAKRMGALAKGDLTVVIDGHDRGDEVGDMSRAVEIFKDNAVERVRLEAEASDARLAAEAESGRRAAERAKAVKEQAEAVQRLGEGLRNLAGGDLRVRLGEGFSESYVQIRDDFNEAVAKLKATMVAVVSSAEAIQMGSGEISTASDDLSRRTEQQAASLEETAAALDEITATLKKSAEGANHARQVVVTADGDAKKSAVVVRQAVEAMDMIAKSSQQIGQIIGVIDEIAFQTNLLALNAGVEAARAGDAGRGFAVVASEVRALAQRSAEAAKEIKSLISASSAQVEQGVKLVAETGKSLERIMVQVTEINEVISAIAAGAQEQATGLAEINKAVNQMDQMTQQNAAMVEESTAASHSLTQETEQLSGLVSQFQVDQTGRDGAMRSALRQAAPHAFRTPVAKPKAAHAPKLAAVPAKAVANGSASGGSNGDWEEF